MWSGVLICVNGLCELSSTFSYLQMENWQTAVGVFQPSSLREAFIMNSFIHSFNN